MAWGIRGQSSSSPAGRGWWILVVTQKRFTWSPLSYQFIGSQSYTVTPLSPLYSIGDIWSSLRSPGNPLPLPPPRDKCWLVSKPGWLQIELNVNRTTLDCDSEGWEMRWDQLTHLHLYQDSEKFWHSRLTAKKGVDWTLMSSPFLENGFSKCNATWHSIEKLWTLWSATCVQVNLRDINIHQS